MGFDLSLVIDLIMNNSQDTIYFKDRESKFLLNSKAHAIQFGIEEPKDLVGMSDFDFFPEEFARNAYQDELAIMETGIPIIGKVEKWEEAGESVWFSASKYPFYDREGNIIGTWGTSRDITTLKLAEEELTYVNKQLEKANLQLKEQSNMDGLSRLYNHRHFCETLENTIFYYRKAKERQEDNTFCVMMLDIDCFKQINDTYGHLIGDIAIKHVAELITSNTRDKDICFRCGGDEFAIILLDTGIAKGRILADRIRTVIEESHLIAKDIDLLVTVSIGISCYDDEEDINSIIQKADNKLYMSKRMGRNQVN